MNTQDKYSPPKKRTRILHCSYAIVAAARNVYVDDMHKYPMGQYRRMKMSHMIADTDQELHAMADCIGVKRKWFQGDHYDICLSMRAKAVAAGAVEITLTNVLHGRAAAKNRSAPGIRSRKRSSQKTETLMARKLTTCHANPWP